MKKINDWGMSEYCAFSVLSSFFSALDYFMILVLTTLSQDNFFYGIRTVLISIFISLGVILAALVIVCTIYLTFADLLKESKILELKEELNNLKQ